MSPDPHPNAPDFLHLIARARSGSTEALGRLFMDCRDYLLLVANEKLEPDLHGKVSPSDVVQETFLEAQRDFGRFHGERRDELLAWLCRILVNNVQNATRQFRAVQMRDVSREVPLVGGAGDSPAPLPVPQDTPSPSDRAIANEEREMLQRTMPQLPERYQQVLRLRYTDKLDFPAIGQAMNCSEEAARKLWARAVCQLRKELKPPDDSR